mgnify:CR=1 FL=1
MSEDAMRKKNARKVKMPTSFAILGILLIVMAILTVVVSAAGGEGVEGASLADVVMSPILGFTDAVPVCLFVMILGGFLGVVTKTGALDAGIVALVRSLKGNELLIIPILMFIFSLGGTAYGMGEETVPFYFLLAATMLAAGYDVVVGAAIVLLGAGCGTLGSTINPFAVGAAVDSLSGTGIEVNQAIIIGEGAVLWLVSLTIAIVCVMRYAKKVKRDKGSTFLSLQEQQAVLEEFGKPENAADAGPNATLSGRQKGVLILFAVSFIIMILGVIPWGSFGIGGFEWSAFLTGLPFGEWYFGEATSVFILTALACGVVGALSQREFVDAFVQGVGDIMSVVLIIAFARAITVLMGETGFDQFILVNAARGLEGVSAVVFAPLSYLLYLVMSFLVPSSSGLATLSVPIMGPLAFQLGFSVETMIMIFTAGNGLVNLFTPTCGFIMGGLAISKIEYGTWLKFAAKPIALIAVFSIVFLTVMMLVLQ